MILDRVYCSSGTTGILDATVADVLFNKQDCKQLSLTMDDEKDLMFIRLVGNLFRFLLNDLYCSMTRGITRGRLLFFLKG